MPLANLEDVEIWYETFGDPDDVPVLLIAGVGTQSVRFVDEFCQSLADRFFRVIRFDNRDIGLSTRFEGPGILEVLEATKNGETPEVAYTLDDMAEDAVQLLDHLGIEKAHIYGVSMGGMIAQIIAIRHPERTLSLTSVMSSTGSSEVGQPTEEAIQALIQPGPTDREGAIDHDVKLGRIWASADYLNEDRMREYAAMSFDRNGDRSRDGGTRQAAAIATAPNREEALAELTVPTLVIHGTADCLIDPSGGERTAEVIPGAELLMIENMGHDSPPELFGPIIEAFTRHAIAAMR